MDRKLLEFFNDEGEPELAVGKSFVRKLYEQTQGAVLASLLTLNMACDGSADVETSFVGSAPWIRTVSCKQLSGLTGIPKRMGDKHLFIRGKVWRFYRCGYQETFLCIGRAKYAAQCGYLLAGSDISKRQ